MADRGFGSSLETALSSESASLAFGLFLGWPGGDIRLASWVGTKSYDGNDWVGAGDLINIDKIVDTVDKSDVGVQVIVNYLDDDIRNELTTTATEDIVGTSASIFMFLLDAATGAVTDGYEIFPGKLDEVVIEDSGSSGSIILRIASELAGLDKRHFLRLTDAHQQYLFPGDTGLKYSAQMDQPVVWGRKPLLPYVPGTPSVPPLVNPYPGYGDQYTFPVSGYGPPGG